MRDRDREMLGDMVDAIDRFLVDKREDFGRWDREGGQPEAFIQAPRDVGLFGLVIREEFGGVELSNAAYTRVLAQTSSHEGYDVATRLEASMTRSLDNEAIRIAAICGIGHHHGSVEGALEQNRAATEPQRHQGGELVIDVIETAKSKSLNPPKVAGLLSTFGQSIQTVASLWGAKTQPTFCQSVGHAT